VGHRAVGLAWLPPSADALLALTADPPDARSVARDPAAVAVVLRFARPTPDPDHFVFSSALLTQPSLCDNAAALLAHTAVNSGPASASSDKIFRLGDVAAAVASELAARSGCCAPAAAFAAGKLAPLGWYAVHAIDPEAVTSCLNDPEHPVDPEHVQRQRWGLSAAAVARRLAGRWRLAPWIATTVGFLRLDAEDAVAAGAPDGLFRVVQLAVAVAERALGSLGLTVPRALADWNPLSAEATALAEAASKSAPVIPDRREAPGWLLARLLKATAEARRAAGSLWLSEAEARTDRLADALAGLRADLDARVRDAKLESMAQFAAGASHEINNPLAVIRGHAQLLLSREDDPDRRRQLEAIVRQTRRVHDLLQGTLQFARPPRPEPTPVSVADWLTEAVTAYGPDAETKGVSLVLADPASGADWRQFDRGQMRHALDHLVRNAVEAAPPGGWVRVGLERWGGTTVVTVEDSGPGPAADDVAHLFDPFFSGRTAGRGRGLGLAIAWRLARLNDGDVRYAPAPGGPTRFVLFLPVPAASSERKAA
jgi:signal transduction histidine kinase